MLMVIYPLNMVIVHKLWGPFIVDIPIKNGDFPYNLSYGLGHHPDHPVIWSVDDLSRHCHTGWIDGRTAVHQTWHCWGSTGLSQQWPNVAKCGQMWPNVEVNHKKWGFQGNISRFDPQQWESKHFSAVPICVEGTAMQRPWRENLTSQKWNEEAENDWSSKTGT